MPSTAVQGANALLQRQQTFVDFSALQARLPVIIICICSKVGAFISSGQCCQCGTSCMACHAEAEQMICTQQWQRSSLSTATSGCILHSSQGRCLTA